MLQIPHTNGMLIPLVCKLASQVEKVARAGGLKGRTFPMNTNRLEIDPWQLCRAELVPFSSTYPLSHLVDDGPASYSEADLHAYTLWRRTHETEPPIVPSFPPGTWSVD